MICGDCQRRLQSNPLRILDCKVPICRESVVGAPSILQFLSESAADHFSELQRLLTLFGVDFDVVPTMVRGLDYYTGTIFEIQGTVGELGAQSTIVGGGRYNDLVARFGGRPTPTIGFAFGLERLLLMIGDRLEVPQKKRIFVAGVGDDSLDRAMEIARRLRQAGFSVETPYRSGSLRSQLKRADKSAARIAVIAGADEAARGAVTIRDLQTGVQEEIAQEALLTRIEEFK